MSLRSLFFTFLIFLFWVHTDAQKLIHYTTKDGVPSDELFNGLQDKDGFILINSKDGLIRFDGENFKLYTVQDGLTDNEILQSEKDKEGNVWLMPFFNSICIYKDGKIYNDSTNKKIATINQHTISDDLWSIGKSKKGNVLLYQRTSEKKGNLIFVRKDSIETIPVRSKVYGPIEEADGTYWTNKSKIYYKPRQGTVRKSTSSLKTVHEFFPYQDYWYCIDNPLKLNSCLKKVQFKKGRLHILKSAPFQLITPDEDKDDILFYNDKVFITQRNVIYTCNLDLENLQTFYEFAPDVLIRGAFLDRQKNMWIVTKAHGLYLAPNAQIQSFLGDPITKKIQSPFFVTQNEQDLIYPKGKKLFWNGRSIKLPKGVEIQGKIKAKKDLAYFMTKDGQFMTITRDGKHHLYSTDYKGGYKDFSLSKNKLAVAYFFGLTLSDLGKEAERILGRTTAIDISDFNNKIYIGTLSGLYTVEKEKNVWKKELVTNRLRHRISSLDQDKNGILWVQEQNELVALYNDKIIGRLSELSGLASSTLNNFNIGKDRLVVSTNKGVSIVPYSWQNDTLRFGRIKNVTKENGLLDNYIKQAAIYKGKLIVQTNETIQTIDLNYNEKPLSSYKPKIIQFRANGERIPLDSLQLNYRQRYISIDFASLIYANKPSQYEYRLVEQGIQWNKTSGRTCIFQDLSPNSYNFELRARYNDGSLGPITGLQFNIEPAIWQTVWFRFGVLLFALGSILYSSIRWYKRRKDKLRSEKHFAQLRIQALKAQMNPHFIFNSLNSIQSVMNSGDIKLANTYLVQFSRLIRQSLNYANIDFISLENELTFLTNYIQLEQLRLKNSFDYSIKVDPQINPNELFIPPMLLQIYVENAIKHRITPLDSGGHIRISFSLHKTFLHCIIDDNGIGRTKADLKNNKIYTSKGTLLNEERISVYKQILDSDILIKWTDKLDENNESQGTRVELKIPQND